MVGVPRDVLRCAWEAPCRIMMDNGFGQGDCLVEYGQGDGVAATRYEVDGLKGGQMDFSKLWIAKRWSAVKRALYT